MADLRSYELDRKRLEDMAAPVVVLLEDRRMGMCNHWNDEHVLVDVYRGNDHEGQLHIPYKNFRVLPGGALIAGLKGIRDPNKPDVVEPAGRPDYNHVEHAMLRFDDPVGAEKHYHKRTGR